MTSSTGEPISRLSLPAGSYVLHATGVLRTNTGSMASTSCFLRVIRSDDNVTLGDFAENALMVPASAKSTYTLQAAVTVATPVQVAIACAESATQGLITHERSITAITVGAIAP